MAAESKKPFFIPQEQAGQQTEVIVTAPAATVTDAVTTPSLPVEKKEPYLPLVSLKSLPSNFLPYPKGTEISYYPYKFGELKKFAQSKLSVKQRYEFILEGIVISGMDKNLLTFNDFLYIALLRKISSVGVHDVTVKFNCGKCRFENTHHVKLDALDFDEIEVPELPAYLTVNNKDLSFSPLTVGDFFSLFREGKEKDSVAVLAMQCRSHKFQEAYDTLFNANPEDSELLEELNKIFYHGLAIMKIPCQNKEAVTTEQIEGIEVEKTVHCDYTNRIELGDPDLIVQPFRRDNEPVKSRIRFGSGTAPKS